MRMLRCLMIALALLSLGRFVAPSTVAPLYPEMVEVGKKTLSTYVAARIDAQQT